MGRILGLVYAGVVYVFSLASFLYSIGWLGDVPGLPTTLDGQPGKPALQALLIDVGLLALFAAQHSVMARPGFKRWWTRIVPSEVERSAYVLASNVAMIALFTFWQPLPDVVYQIESPVLRGVAYGAFALGIATILYSSFLIDHFDLFGLRQVWLALRGKPYIHRPFATPGVYKYIRHPLYVGWFLFFWATPTMSVGHLLMALGTTGYILVAIVLEERDLLEHFGADYRAWRARTPRFLPRFGSRARRRSRGMAETA